MFTVFNIPFCKNDLYNPASSSGYLVEDTFTSEEIYDLLKNFEYSLQEEGPNCIPSYFNVFFNVISDPSIIAKEIKIFAIECLNKVFKLNEQSTALVISAEENLRNIPQSYQNNFKMLIYLLCQYVIDFDNETYLTSNIPKTPGKRGIKKKQFVTSNEFQLEAILWDIKREECLTNLRSIMSISIQKLWDPPMIDSKIIDLISNTCYKVLENLNIPKSNHVFPLITDILGICLSVHNLDPNSFSLKILNIIQNHEHSTVVVPLIIVEILTKYNLQHLFGYIMKDIETIASQQHEMGGISGTGGTSKELLSPFRLLSNFMTEICNLQFSLYLPYMSILARYLDGNSYSLRNATLTIMGQCIIKESPSVDLPSETDEGHHKQTTKDKYYSYIKDHIYDTNAFVRSKCFQILCQIYNASVNNDSNIRNNNEYGVNTSTNHLNIMPRYWLAQFLQLAKDRLDDKSSNVRKNALQFLTLTLNPIVNPYLSEQLDLVNERIKRCEDKISQNVVDCAKLVQAKMCLQSEINATNERVLLQENGLQTVIPNGHCNGEIGADENDGMEHENQNIEAVNKETGFDNETFTTRQRDLEEEITLIQEKNNTDIKTLETLQFYQYHLSLVTQELYPIVVNSLLFSKNQTDCLEAINFLVTGLKHRIHKLSVWGIKECLYHLSTTNQTPSALTGGPTSTTASGGDGIKDKVVNIFANLFFAAPSESGDNNVRGTENDSSDELDNMGKRVTRNLNSRKTIKTASSFAILNNMLDFIGELQPDEMMCFEFLVKEFLKQELFPADFPVLLIEKFKAIATELKTASLNNNTNNNASADLRNYAKNFTSTLHLIKIMEIGSTSKDFERHSLCWHNMEVLIDMGTMKINLHNLMNDRNENFVVDSNDNFQYDESYSQLYRSSLIAQAFTKLRRETKILERKIVQKALRLPSNHRIFKRMIHLLLTKFPCGKNDPENKYWSPFAQSTVQLIFALCENPEVLCSQILSNASKMCFSSTNNDADFKDNSIPDSKVRVEQLAHLIFLVGEIGLLHFSYTYESLIPHMRSRDLSPMRVDLNILNGATPPERAKRIGKAKGRRTGQDSTLRSDNSGLVSEESTTAEKELCMAGTDFDDTDIEFARHVCENELFHGSSSLLKPYLQLIESINKKLAKYPDHKLRNSAMLALLKFMVVSSKICENYLPLIFTILSNENNQSLTDTADDKVSIMENLAAIELKINIIIGIGDLIVRFPTIVEPWVNYIYARLTDSEPYVRLVTLKILSHLIGRDMIIAKEQLSEIAKRLIDSEEHIKKTAKLFFDDLSNKGNSIYNALPDIIGKLSSDTRSLDFENFVIIMKYLCTYIQKDRQIDGIIEKICQRISATNDQEQALRLIKCVSFLPHTDRSIKKLMDELPQYQSKLYDEAFKDILLSQIIGAFKPEKPDFKNHIEEFGQKVETINKNMDDIEALSQQARKMMSVSKKKRNALVNMEPIVESQQTNDVLVNENTEFMEKTLTFADNDSVDLETSLSQSHSSKSGKHKLENQRSIDGIPQPTNPFLTPMKSNQNKKRDTKGTPYCINNNIYKTPRQILNLDDERINGDVVSTKYKKADETSMAATVGNGDNKISDSRISLKQPLGSTDENGQLANPKSMKRSPQQSNPFITPNGLNHNKKRDTKATPYLYNSAKPLSKTLKLIESSKEVIVSDNDVNYNSKENGEIAPKNTSARRLLRSPRLLNTNNNISQNNNYNSVNEISKENEESILKPALDQRILRSPRNLNASDVDNNLKVNKSPTKIGSFKCLEAEGTVKTDEITSLKRASAKMIDGNNKSPKVNLKISKTPTKFTNIKFDHIDEQDGECNNLSICKERRSKKKSLLQISSEED